MPLPDVIPGLGPKAERPRLKAAVHLSALGLSPVEGFVLSRIDGASSYEQICTLTGLGTEPTLEILRKLKQAGAIYDTSTPLLERLDDGSAVSPEELAPGPGLSPEVKARIIRLHRRMSHLSAHELLGVPAGADRATIKRAYGAASKELHPDRYYGVELGPFREKLAELFSRLRQAHDVLHGK